MEHNRTVNRLQTDRVLALDVGDRRIGAALGDPSGTLARPLTTLTRRSRQEDFATIAALVAEHAVRLVVVGRPLSLDGTEGPQARKVGRYARELATRLPVPVVLWDERYSTVTAGEILREIRRPAKRATRRPGEIDAVAAAVILQSYLDSQKEIGVSP